MLFYIHYSRSCSGRQPCHNTVPALDPVPNKPPLPQDQPRTHTSLSHERPRRLLKTTTRGELTGVGDVLDFVGVGMNYTLVYHKKAPSLARLAFVSMLTTCSPPLPFLLLLLLLSSALHLLLFIVYCQPAVATGTWHCRSLAFVTMLTIRPRPAVLSSTSSIPILCSSSISLYLPPD